MSLTPCRSRSPGAAILVGGTWPGMLAETLGVRVWLARRETARWPIVVGFHAHYLLTFLQDRVVADATLDEVRVGLQPARTACLCSVASPVANASTSPLATAPTARSSVLLWRARGRPCLGLDRRPDLDVDQDLASLALARFAPRT
jgi:hypothetical protein